ncbi:hypothetical protein BMF35_a0784 [Aurantiacibacter gangjinensis]|nr:hypothetical protein BMF35_a0784 [Aurantiacibacter gangjinensis]
MKNWIIALAAPLALAAQPAMAQEQEPLVITPDEEAVFDAMAEAFTVEPLTPEQEARMPIARRLAAQVIPEGAMAEMMSGMFDGLLSPLMELGGNSAAAALNQRLGYALSEDEIEESAAREALELIDPAWEQREELTMQAMQGATTAMMSAMEPMMRDVMAELYAIRFTDEQLADISAFYATETGAVFARESYTMASDPRIVGAMFADPEATFGAMGEMFAEIQAATADLPPQRGYADLSEQERNTLSRLTGIGKADLEASLEAGAAAAEF